MFKVGDKIRVKEEHKKAFFHLTEDLTVKGYNVADCLLTDMGMFISDEWFEKVEDKGMFKAGEKVKLKNCVVDGQGTVVSCGFCGIVEKVEGENVYLKNIFYPFFKAKDLEKVKEKEMKKLTLQEYANKYNCFTAQDRDGCRFEYNLDNKPTLSNFVDVWCSGHGFKNITDKTLPFDGDWKGSLCEPKKENNMKKRFRLKDYQGKYCMNFANEDEYKAFCKFLDDNDRTWCDGDSYIDTGCRYNDETVIYFNEGLKDSFGCVEDGYTLLKYSDFDWSEKVEFEIGKKYVVGDYERTLEDEDFCNNPDNHRILVAYIPNKKYSFVCVTSSYENKYENDEIYGLTLWKYAKPIPEYKPYSKPKFEWIGKEVKHKDTHATYKIEFISSSKVVFKGYSVKVPLEELHKLYTWLDGSPCGDLNN